MQITAQQIKEIMPNVVGNIAKNKNFQGYNLDSIVSLLNKYALEFDIDSPARWAHYLAQIAHESAEMRYSEEIASGRKYEGRTDLGNIYKGDGVKYKGRGLIQLTGRKNYTTYKGYCGYDVVRQPELLCKPVGAVRSSMWFWRKKGLNAYADADDFATITRRINGGTNGWDSRKKYLAKAQEVLIHRSPVSKLPKLSELERAESE